MRSTLLFKNLLRRPVTETAPDARRRGAGRACRQGRSRRARAARPQPRHPRGRCRLVQCLRARDPRAQQRLLRSRAVRLALRRLAAPCRRAAGDRPGHQEHARGAGAHLRRDARIRNGWWRSAIAPSMAASSPASYAVTGGGRQGGAGRSAHQRLPAHARPTCSRACWRCSNPRPSDRRKWLCVPRTSSALIS